VSGLQASLRAPLPPASDCAALLNGSWATLAADALARRPIGVPGHGAVPLGELAEVTGTPDGTLRLVGDWAQASRLGAGLTEGRVVVEGDVGDEAGIGLSGGSLEIRGRAGARAGAAAPAARRGMTGGEVIVHGDAGPQCGALMRRGLVAVGGTVADHAGVGLIAGTIVAFGDVGAVPGLWSKRGSIVAFGRIDIPSTYRYACTYQPPHLRLLLGRLKASYGLPLEPRHFTGLYHRYSGDLAELGKGEILAWTAS
jgi:formylmethanofuran dehydrogenase subunit C